MVSVIVVVYNGEYFLEEALESLRSQTYQEWEAVIVDDGSTDRTLEIIERFAQSESRARVLRQQNQGVYVGRNRALQMARGEFLAFLDHDDAWLPEKLERQVLAMRTHGVELVYCAYRAYDLEGNERPSFDWESRTGLLEGGELVRWLSRECFVLPSTTLVSRRLLDVVGVFDESVRASADWDLWMRIGLAGYSVFGIVEPLCRYRLCPGSLSRQLFHVFWAHQRFAPRYREIVGREHSLAVDRLLFRNAFTLEGDARRWKDLGAMFDAYRPCDQDGWACRIMTVLRAVLPVRLFWFFSRYVIIPMAWHLERIAQRWEMSK